MKQSAPLLLVSLALSISSCTPGTEESVFGTTSVSPQSTGFTGSIYFLAEGTERLPELSTLTPLGTIYTPRLDISPRSFDEGFPGITDRFEWFALRYQATFEVLTPGTYTFKLLSDDGSKLYVDNNLIIDNDGVHPAIELTGAVTLTAGVHQIEVEYFQGPRTEIALQLFVTPPDGDEQIFSTDEHY